MGTVLMAFNVDFRENRKISQTDLGEKVGLNRSAVASIESGRQKVQSPCIYGIIVNARSAYKRLGLLVL